MSAADLQSRTPGGALAYCEYLTSKGYATAAQVNPWRTAIQKVFETVEGDGWESLDLTSIDLADYLARFRTLAGAQYKAESIVSYGRRVQNAIDAQEHFLATGRPPTFRKGAARRPRGEDRATLREAEAPPAAQRPSAMAPSTSSGLVEFRWALNDGTMVLLHLPPRMEADDINRLCIMIRALQKGGGDQRQIPSRTGEEPEGIAA